MADQLVAFGVGQIGRIILMESSSSALQSPASQDLLALARHGVNKNLPALTGASTSYSAMAKWCGVCASLAETGHEYRAEQVLPIDALPQTGWACACGVCQPEGFDYPVLEAKAGASHSVSDIPVHRESSVDDDIG